MNRTARVLVQSAGMLLEATLNTLADSRNVILKQIETSNRTATADEDSQLETMLRAQSHLRDGEKLIRDLSK